MAPRRNPVLGLRQLQISIYRRDIRSTILNQVMRVLPAASPGQIRHHDEVSNTIVVHHDAR